MRDYTELSKQIQSDISKLLEQDPEAFDVLLYPADASDKETVTTEEDVVGNLESDERAIGYKEPVSVKAKFLQHTFAGSPLGVIDSSADLNEMAMEEPLMMLIGYPDVPKFSIIQYDELHDTGAKEIIAYVHSIATMSMPKTGKIYNIRILPDGKDLFE